MIKMRFSISKVALVVVFGFLFFFRVTHISTKEISWDVLGYYLYLPQSFIQDDPLLTDIDWLKEINNRDSLTASLYQVTTTDTGEPLNFFLMGMSYFYAPFFFLAHWLSPHLSFPQDGFSYPYSLFLVIGGLIYTLIGLVLLRKVLLQFFSEGVTSLTLIIIALGTNYIHHCTLDNIAPVNVLFMLCSMAVYQLIQWDLHKKGIHLFLSILCAGLMALIKPSEIFIFLLIGLWGIRAFNRNELSLQLTRLWKAKYFILAAFFLVVFFALPQLIYWKIKTGDFIVDSYKNPGVGLDLLNPHIVDTLFSFKKGWLVYTPIMALSIFGFFVIYKRNKRLFWPILISILVAFYIISSWSEWWYGAGFSIRPMITLYPLLSISIGYFLTWSFEQKVFWKWATFSFIFFCIFLNNFQWWQLRNYILDPYLTTPSYYKVIFLQTAVPEGASEFLAVKRDFSGQMRIEDKNKYSFNIYSDEDFEGLNLNEVVIDSLNSFYRLSEGREYALTKRKSFSYLTDQDHLFLESSIDFRTDQSIEESPCFVHCMSRKEGEYGYYAPAIINETTISLGNGWRRSTFVWMTPAIRHGSDKVSYYIWNRSKKALDIDNLKIRIYEPLN